jgi:hypothetical protein
MSFTLLPPELQSKYRIAQGILYTFVFLLFCFLIFRSLFPAIIHTFDFKNPTSSKHDLSVPRDSQGSYIGYGKLPQDGSLIFKDGTSGLYREAEFQIDIDKDKAIPNPLTLTLRHGYAATWLPAGPSVENFPEEKLYTADDSYYRLKDQELIRYVSRDAFLSRYPESRAEVVTPEFLKDFDLSESLLGFRPGLLVEYADGFFLITSETEMRPIGSARIFTNVGYRFEDVKKVNAEELGIYTRGKIFLSGDMHPEGTVFLDTDSQKYYIVQNGNLSELLPGEYRDYLLSQSAPITFSESSSNKTVSCNPKKVLIFHRVACEVDLEPISDLVGSDYEMHLQNGGADTDLSYYEVTFLTAVNRQNLNFIITQVKENFLTRFGLL